MDLPSVTFFTKKNRRRRGEEEGKVMKQEMYYVAE
jgi:hypothetical protein